MEAKDLMSETIRVRQVAFLATAVATCCTLSAIISLPLLYSYIQGLQSHAIVEVDFCRTRTRDLWKDVIEMEQSMGRHLKRRRDSESANSDDEIKKREKRAWLFGKWIREAGIGTRSAKYEAYPPPPQIASPMPASSYYAAAPIASYGSDAAIEENNKCNCPCIQGPMGPQGPPGDDGLDGIDGAQGENGKPGRDGQLLPPNGVPLQPCLICLPGEVGGMGLIGLPGPKGLRGLPGSNGRNGIKGEVGVQGAIGPIGITGARGSRGDRGNPGKIIEVEGPLAPSGVKGMMGAKGGRGLKGNAGIEGMKGAKGPKGEPGGSGIDGRRGAKGATGPQGIQGSGGSCGHCNPPRLPPGY